MYGAKISSRATAAGGATKRRARPRRSAAQVVAILLTAFAPLVLVAVISTVAVGQRSASAATVPGWEVAGSTDVHSVGSITFVDASGTPVTSGSLNAPFAAYAVGSKALGTAADNEAVLYTYAPVEGQAPGNWQGDPLGVNSTFDPAPSTFPSAIANLANEGLPVATEKLTAPGEDETPAGVIADWPVPTQATDPAWKNLYQVRLYGIGDSLSSTDTYDTVDIAVDTTAQTWSVAYPAGGAPLPTASGSPSPTPSPTPSASPSPSPSASPSPTPSPTPSPKPSASPSPTPSASPSPTPSASASPSPSASASPSPSASGTSTIVATDSSGNVLAADPNLLIGDSVTLTIPGFTAGESVTAVLHSTPQTLAPGTAGSKGSLTYTFTVPAGLPDGSHSIVFTGANSLVTATWPFTVGDVVASPSPGPSGVLANDPGTGTTTDPTSGSPTLPFTGANLGKPLLYGVAALWSGLILILLGRPWVPNAVGAASSTHSRRRQSFGSVTTRPSSHGRHRAT